MRINIHDLQGWDEFQKEFSHLMPSEEQLNKALDSTTARITAWLKTKAVRELSLFLNLPQRILRRRFRNFRLRGEMRGGKLWLGLDGIPFIWLRPVQSDQGVKTNLGGHYEKGAFIAKNRKNGRMMVLKRRGKTWQHHEGKLERGPVFTPSLKLEEKGFLWLEKILHHPSLEKKIYERLEHELSWRMSQ